MALRFRGWPEIVKRIELDLRTMKIQNITKQVKEDADEKAKIEAEEEAKKQTI